MLGSVKSDIKITKLTKLTKLTKITMVKQFKRKSQSKQLRRKSNVNLRSGPMLKISDLAFGTLVTGTAAIASLLAVPQGTNVTDRTGSSIRAVNLQINASFTASNTLIGRTDSINRILIVKDRQQAQATTPAITDIINSASVIGLRNVYFLNRFQILHEQFIKVDTYNPSVQLKKTLSLNHISSFASGLSTDITSNGIYLIYVSNNSINPPTMTWASRLNFLNV